MVWPALIATYGPRVVIPSFFISQRVKEMHNWKDIFQSTAFSFLFVASVISFFSSQPWLSVIPGTAAAAYWMMTHDKENQERYRYMDWAVTTPLMLVFLLHANQVPQPQILGLLAADLGMIWAGFKGVQEQDLAKKHRWFLAGCLLFLPIIATLLTLKKTKYAVWLTLAVWSLYPLIWYLNEVKTLDEDRTAMAYSVMDAVAKVGLVYFLHA